MFDDETLAFLHSGCALIVGTVDDDGVPHAGRAWGLEVRDPGPPGRLRLLLDSEDLVTVAHTAAGGAIAITATSVRTFRSLQMKGHATGVEPACEADLARAARYCDAFFTDIEEADRTPRGIVESMRPLGYVACTAEVGEVFDQTPGPRAGASIPRAGA